MVGRGNWTWTAAAWLAAVVFLAAGCGGEPGTGPRGGASGETSESAAGGGTDAGSDQTGPEDALTAKARKFIDDLFGGNVEAVRATFDEKMSEAMPAAAVEQVRESLTAKYGAFKEQGATAEQAAGPYKTMHVECAFDRGRLKARVVYDSQGRVSGLWFDESPLPTAYRPAAYVDASAFDEREVTVGDGEWPLPGTVSMPRGAKSVAAVVLVHGSGPNDRDESVGANKPFRDLAGGLASRGIAVLRYEKRTRVYGERLAAMTDLTVREETVLDAVAAVKLLRETAGVDERRVFVLGHSLGGMLAPRIARRSPGLAGLVLLAAPARPLEELMLQQTRYLVELDGQTSEEDRERLHAVENGVAQIRGLRSGVLPDTGRPVLGAPPAYWIDLGKYDPILTADRAARPMLILRGGRDYQVTEEDFELWKRGVGDRANVTMKEYGNLNHLFVAGDATKASGPDEYQKAGHVDRQVIEDIATWIEQVGKAEAGE